MSYTACPTASIGNINEVKMIKENKKYGSNYNIYQHV